jgi:hypothetical protein
MSKGLLSQLQQLAGRLTVGQVILVLFAIGLALLAVDYGRMLLLRREIVRNLPSFVDVH